MARPNSLSADPFGSTPSQPAAAQPGTPDAAQPGAPAAQPGAPVAAQAAASQTGPVFKMIKEGVMQTCKIHGQQMGATFDRTIQCEAKLNNPAIEFDIPDVDADTVQIGTEQIKPDSPDYHQDARGALFVYPKILTTSQEYTSGMQPAAPVEKVVASIKYPKKIAIRDQNGNDADETDQIFMEFSDIAAYEAWRTQFEQSKADGKVPEETEVKATVVVSGQATDADAITVSFGDKGEMADFLETAGYICKYTDSGGAEHAERFTSAKDLARHIAGLDPSNVLAMRTVSIRPKSVNGQVLPDEYEVTYFDGDRGQTLTHAAQLIQAEKGITPTNGTVAKDETEEGVLFTVTPGISYTAGLNTHDHRFHQDAVNNAGIPDEYKQDYSASGDRILYNNLGLDLSLRLFFNALRKMFGIGFVGWYDRGWEDFRTDRGEGDKYHSVGGGMELIWNASPLWEDQAAVRPLQFKLFFTSGYKYLWGNTTFEQQPDPVDTSIHSVAVGAGFDLDYIFPITDEFGLGPQLKFEYLHPVKSWGTEAELFPEFRVVAGVSFQLQTGPSQNFTTAQVEPPESLRPDTGPSPDPTKPAVPMPMPGIHNLPKSITSFDTSALFARNSWKLKRGAENELMKVVNELKQYKGVPVAIKVVGSADPAGKKDMPNPPTRQGAFPGNLVLSQKRAKTVTQKLNELIAKENQNLPASSEPIKAVFHHTGTGENLLNAWPVSVSGGRFPKELKKPSAKEDPAKTIEIPANVEPEKGNNGRWYIEAGGKLQLGKRNGKRYDPAGYLLFYIGDQAYLVKNANERAVTVNHNVAYTADGTQAPTGYESVHTASMGSGFTPTPKLTAGSNPRSQEIERNVKAEIAVLTGNIEANGVYLELDNPAVANNIPTAVDGEALAHQIVLRGMTSSVTPNCAQVVVHTNNISPETAIEIGKFVRAGIPENYKTLRNRVIVATHEFQDQPTSIAITGIKRGILNLRSENEATGKYLEYWAEKLAGMPAGKYAYPGLPLPNAGTVPPAFGVGTTSSTTQPAPGTGQPAPGTGTVQPTPGTGTGTGQQPSGGLNADPFGP